jgi:hypothetical protein
MGKQSHGTKHHADTTVMCPSCGRKFTHPHHAGVAEDWAEFIGVQFKSKQTERRRVLRNLRSDLQRGQTHPQQAFPRKHDRQVTTKR